MGNYIHKITAFTALHTIIQSILKLLTNYKNDNKKEILIDETIEWGQFIELEDLYKHNRDKIL